METTSKGTPIIMSYNTLISMIETSKIVEVVKVASVFDALVRDALENPVYEYDGEEESYESSADYKLTKLANYFADESYEFIGRSDHFHNLAVDYARQDKYKEACLILERGIALRNASVDLLADYLAYGRNLSSSRKKCKNFYNQLDKLPRSKWNWRVYSFSIDYLLEERDYVETAEEEEAIMEKTVEIAKQFVNKYSSLGADYDNLDTAYTDLANVYTEFGYITQARNVLKKCTDKYARTPKASLKLAQSEFNAGRYSEATNLLSKCTSCLELQESFNTGYPYLLRAFTNASMLFMDQISNKGEQSDNDKKKLISRIRKDLDTAESLKNGKTYSDVEISRLRTILDNQYSDDVSDDDEKW